MEITNEKIKKNVNIILETAETEEDKKLYESIINNKDILNNMYNNLIVLNDEYYNRTVNSHLVFKKYEEHIVMIFSQIHINDVYFRDI